MYLNKNNIKFSINPKLVRGIDYYTKTVFEVKSGRLGAQDALGGGGRYDGLMKIIGGPDTPACGFAMGMERIMLASEYKLPYEKDLIFIVYTSPELKEKAYNLYLFLTKETLKCDIVLDTKSLKSQMRRANKKGAKYVVILGEEEEKMGGYKIKDMEKGEEKFIKKENLPDYFKNI
jgi:histidyl-tRNA synthetase